MRYARWWSSALALAWIAGCAGSSVRPTVTDAVPVTPERLARGNYLVNSVAACGVCHTPRVGDSWLGGERTDLFLGGGSVFHDENDGLRIAVPNISQDLDTGVGAWTDDQLVRAIRDGVTHDGRLMTALMPFLAWESMSDEDARAIVVYLRTTPAVKRPISRADDQIGFAYRVAMKVGAVHHRPARDVRAPARADAKAYGAYLAKLGVCWQCHSLGEHGPTDDADVLMSGSRVPLGDPDYGKVTTLTLSDLHSPGGGSASGAFGLINLNKGDASGTADANTLAGWLSKGYDGYLDTGIYFSAPSANFNNGQFLAALDSVIGKEVLFPVYRLLTGPGSNAKYDIIGWVGFYVQSYTATGSSGTVTGYFSRFTADGVQVESGGSTNLGAVKVELVD